MTRLTCLCPSRLFLAFLSLLACFCVACGAPGVVPWPDGSVAADAGDAGDAPDAPADASHDAAPPPDAAADAPDDRASPDAAVDAPAPLDGPTDASAESSVDAPADGWPDLIPVDCAERIHDDAGPWPARPGMEPRLRITVRVPTFSWTTQDAAECSITRREPPLAPLVTFRAAFCGGAPPGALCPMVAAMEGALYFRDASGVVMDARPDFGVGEPYPTTDAGMRATIVSSVLTLSCGRALQVVITGCAVR